MTTRELFTTWASRYCDYDGKFSAQCKDVFSQFNHDVIGAPYITGNPVDLWYKFFSNKPLAQYYSRINNSLTFVPKLGDVAIFDATKSNPYGHISICTGSGNWLWFESFDQNFPLGTPCHYQKHNYISPKFLGVFRPLRGVS